MDGGGGVPLFFRVGLRFFDLRGCYFPVVIEEVEHDGREWDRGETGDGFLEGV